MTNSLSITRATIILTSYALTCDRIAELTAELKLWERDEKRQRPLVLEQIGERRSCTIDGVVRTFQRGETISVSRQASHEDCVKWAHSAGVPTTIQPSEIVAPAVLRKHTIEGTIPLELVEITKTPIVTVT